MRYAFTDGNNYNNELRATTWREAVIEAKETYGIKGRVRIVDRGTAFGDWRDYQLDGSYYTFQIRQIEG